MCFKHKDYVKDAEFITNAVSTPFAPSLSSEVIALRLLPEI